MYVCVSVSMAKWSVHLYVYIYISSYVCFLIIRFFLYKSFNLCVYTYLCPLLQAISISMSVPYISMCMYVFVSLFASMFASISTSKSMPASISLLVNYYSSNQVCICIYIFIHVLFLSLSLSIYLSVYLSVYLSIDLSIYPYVSLCKPVSPCFQIDIYVHNYFFAYAYMYSYLSTFVIICVDRFFVPVNLLTGATSWRPRLRHCLRTWDELAMG